MAASQEEVKLWRVVGSPFVGRVQIALKIKGVEYQFLEQDLQNKSDLLLKYNPVYKKVPVLVHNEKPISESLVIVEYIDETWKGNPILPTDPYQRALARCWSKFIDDKVFSAAWKSVFTADEKAREKNFKDATILIIIIIIIIIKKNKNFKDAHEVLQFLENELKGKFSGGEELGFVDIAAVFIAFWIPLVQKIAGLQLLTSEKFPKLYKWSQEFISHPLVKEALPPRDPLLGFFKGLYERITASK